MNENKNQETVTITKAEYKSLLEDSLFLECLRYGGMDTGANGWWAEAEKEFEERKSEIE